MLEIFSLLTFIILASCKAGFDLSIRVFQRTSSATSWGIMQTAFVQPYLLIIPLAGVLVDRHNPN